MRIQALCTEAALNAIKRQYPQIYQSSERLLLDHAKIAVQARDFMISVKEVVPSSARSSATAAAPLPPQLVPLLSVPLEEVKAALDRILPKSRKRSALEEAQWEEDHPDGEAGAFEREMMLQALESQRINRPRLLLCGGSGMGQRAVGAAALHHLEGYSVQSFDLGTLTGDSARVSLHKLSCLIHELTFVLRHRKRRLFSSLLKRRDMPLPSFTFPP